MGVYTFRIRGTLCHKIGSLIPPNGEQPKFAQIYIMDSDQNQQIQRRLQYGHGHIDEHILQDLLTMMQRVNPYYAIYKIAKERTDQDVDLRLNLTTWGTKKHDPRLYNIPTTSEVGVIINKDLAEVNATRDLIIERCSGELQRISELHSAYLPLRFPLLFPHGEQGWDPEIPLSHASCQPAGDRSNGGQQDLQGSIEESENEESNNTVVTGNI
jgi:hypothetical protein